MPLARLPLPPKSLRELAAHVGGEVVGEASLSITGVNGLAEAGSSEISFYGNTRYRKQLEKTQAAAVLVGMDFPAREGLTVVKVSNPHLAFAKISTLFHPARPFAKGVSAQAFVHPSARVHPDATVMAGATVNANAEVGARSVLHPGVYLGEDVRLGEDCLLYPNATVREGCLVGARVTLHAGCVVGADGFGFAFDPERPEHYKIPQAGIVRIEDDVEIGACSCIDRATLGETVIGQGTKIDNLVQVAHNVKVGPLSLICAQAGISGSAEIGTGVILAGQVGVVGHIRVGNLARVGAQSGVAHNVPDGATLSGSPAMDHRAWLKASMAYGHLSELVREVRALRKKVEALEKEKQG